MADAPGASRRPALAANASVISRGSADRGRRPRCPTTSRRRPDGAVAVVRRAPFSDNPRVGARGPAHAAADPRRRAAGVRRARATTRCSIDRITKLARCSRVSFYQYFASKEDVFRQLAGQVARQVERVDRGAGPAHRRRRRLGRDARRGSPATREIHARYEPVFHCAARATTRSPPSRGAPARRRSPGSTRGWSTTTLPPRQLDPVIRLLLECAEPHARRQRASSARSRPTPTRATGSRSPSPMCCTARCSACDADVNVHAPTARRRRPLEFGPEMLELLAHGGRADVGRLRQRRRSTRCSRRRATCSSTAATTTPASTTS